MTQLGTTKALLRRGEVKKSLGISEQEMSNMVKEGLIQPYYYREGSRAFYLRTQLEKFLKVVEERVTA